MHRSMLSVASVAALTAVIATVCTLAAVHFTQPEVVQAQKPERAGTQIGPLVVEVDTPTTTLKVLHNSGSTITCLINAFGD